MGREKLNSKERKNGEVMLVPQQMYKGIKTPFHALSPSLREEHGGLENSFSQDS